MVIYEGEFVMKINAFKAFTGDFSNKYGERFELGVVYSKVQLL